MTDRSTPTAIRAGRPIRHDARITVPRLTDGVVTLRLWRAADVPAIVVACQDPEIPRWTLVPEPYTADDARLWLATHEPGLRSGRRVELAIVEAGEPDAVMGSVALVRHPTADERAEVGYWVAAPCRGRGAATRAVRLVTDWGFAALGVARVELLAEPENVASQRVAAAAGFVRERVLHRHRRQKGRWRDFVLFSRSAATNLPQDTPASD